MNLSSFFKNICFILLAAICLLSGGYSVAEDVQDYILGPGDTISISVYDNPDLSINARISEKGKITFPLLNEVSVVGLSPRGVEELIETSLKRQDFLKEPQVSVNVQEFRSQEVAILGEVVSPGKHFLQRSSTIIDLIAEAGGVTSEAGDIIHVLSKQDGRTVKREVDLDAFFDGDISQDININSGDTVVVPRMKVFYVYGEVGRPGSFRLERNMTVMQALSVAGGITDRGTQRGIKVKRRDSNNKLVEVPVGLTDLIEPDDVLYIKESLF